MSLVINNPEVTGADNALQVRNYTPDNTVRAGNTPNVTSEGGNAFFLLLHPQQIVAHGMSYLLTQKHEGFLGGKRMHLQAVQNRAQQKI